MLVPSGVKGYIFIVGTDEGSSAFFAGLRGPPSSFTDSPEHPVPFLEISTAEQLNMSATPTVADVPPGMEGFVVGIIGMGDMGKMYARRLSDAGWR